MASNMDKYFKIRFFNLSGNKKKRVKISVQIVCWSPSRSSRQSNFGAVDVSPNNNAELKIKGNKGEKIGTV